MAGLACKVVCVGRSGQWTWAMDLGNGSGQWIWAMDLGVRRNDAVRVIPLKLPCVSGNMFCRGQDIPLMEQCGSCHRKWRQEEMKDAMRQDSYETILRAVGRILDQAQARDFSVTT